MSGIAEILDAYKRDALDRDEAQSEIANCLFQDIDHTVIDYYRQERTGSTEVIYAEYKKAEDVAEIFFAMANAGNNVLATRCSENAFLAVKRVVPAAEFHEIPRMITLQKIDPPLAVTSIAVVTAGTSDIPVAEEVAVTAEFYGSPVMRVNDVGVAGVHRLLSRIDDIRGAKVVVVIAGMDGALPSVVGGLVKKPVIAVPTSVGYGASFGGVAALLTMLNSCAPGISVVNIDNGYGAGYTANIINQL